VPAVQVRVAADPAAAHEQGRPHHTE
jgi:hypothetical protein